MEDKEHPGFTKAVGNMTNDSSSIDLMRKKVKYEFVSNWLTIVVEGGSWCWDIKILGLNPCVAVMKHMLQNKELNRF